MEMSRIQTEDNEYYKNHEYQDLVQGDKEEELIERELGSKFLV